MDCTASLLPEDEAGSVVIAAAGATGDGSESLMSRKV
jgi:hypothetical protein